MEYNCVFTKVFLWYFEELLGGFCKSEEYVGQVTGWGGSCGGGGGGGHPQGHPVTHSPIPSTRLGLVSAPIRPKATLSFFILRLMILERIFLRTLIIPTSWTVFNRVPTAVK